MLKIYSFVFFFLLGLCPVGAESDIFTLDEIEELEVEEIDIYSIGIAVFGRLFHDDLFNFKRNDGAGIVQETNENGQGGIQFSFHYGLDRYLFKGLSVGVKFDYLYANVNDVTLNIDDKATFFTENTGFFTVHSLSLIPNIELSIFNFLENLFSFDIASYWDVYVYTGIRLSYNIYNEDGDLDDEILKLENLENFVFGFEFGIGSEVFFNNSWSIKLEYSYSSQNTDFVLIEGDEEIADVEFDLITSKIALGINYYF